MRRLVLVLMAAGVMGGAQPRTTDIAELFASKEPWDLAWGARLAADGKDARFGAQVIELLKHTDQRTRETALDAAVELKLAVPGEILEPLAREGRQDALILIGLHPETHAGLAGRLLDVGVAYDRTWLILTSILFEPSPPGYASRLLKEWTLQIRVRVTDPNVGGGGGVGVGDFGCGFGIDVPSQYPPRHWHTIEVDWPKTGTVLARAPHSLYYRTGGCSVLGYGFSRDPYRLDFLRALAKFTDPLPAGLISYRSPLEYERDADSLIESLRGSVRDLRSGLVANGKLAADDPAWPKLDVKVIDQRVNPSTPLPKIDWKF